MNVPLKRPGEAARASFSKLWWVIPAYNEAASIADLIDRIGEVSEHSGLPWEIVLVDDGSADATGAIARERAARQPVRVLRNEPNQGLGRTIRRGLRDAAAAAGPGDVVLTLDADLTQDPAYVPVMLDRLAEGHDVVIASRYRKGSAVEGLSGFRTLMSFGAGALVALLRPIRGVRDYSCGFRAYRAATLAAAFERDGDGFVVEPGFACMVEIAQRLRGHASFAEVPFVLRYDAKRKGSAIRILPTVGAYFRVISRELRRDGGSLPWGVFSAAAASIALGSTGQLLLRLGARDADGAGPIATFAAALTRPVFLGGLASYVLSSLLWLAVLSRLPVSVAYPFGATGYVLVVLLAWASGEAVPPLRWIGVLLVIVGVLLVGWLGAAPSRRGDP